MKNISIKRLFSLVSFIITLVSIIYSVPVLAQTNDATIKGTVVDEQGEPLIGVTVFVKGRKETGTITDEKGLFAIAANKDETLQFSCLGFIEEELSLGSKTQLHIVLREDRVAIDEVVVIAYGQVKKQDLTGSVSVVKVDEVKDAPVSSIDQALQGRVAGAEIMSTTGEPGATTSIRIRGTRSITASNEPLIVVDGMIDAVHDLNDLNPEDIESITVLKDASSTAIYGSRGANGVIIVTTKVGKGIKSKPTIYFKTDVGFSQLPSQLDIMNASEFAMYRNDYAFFGSDPNNPDVGQDSPLSDAPYPNPYIYGEGTDWIDEVTRTAMYQNYYLSLSGRSDKSTYFASIGYNENQGIIDNSGQDKVTGMISLSQQLFKWLKVSYKGSYTWRLNNINKTSIGGKAWYSSAQYLTPIMDPYTGFNPLYNGGQAINTPRNLIDMQTYYHDRYTLSNSANLTITPLKDLTINAQATHRVYQRHTFKYDPSTLPRKQEGEGGYAYRNEYNDGSLSTETTVSYKPTFSKSHSFDALAGFSTYDFSSDNFSLSGNGYMDDEVKWNNMNALEDKQNLSASTSYSSRFKLSSFLRLNYNYKSKYYLTGTVRYDGASNFADNNKWAMFPSVAVKWNIANEEFMKHVDWMDEFSVRLSAGRTGNDAIGSYSSLAKVSSTSGGYIFDEKQPVAYYRSRLASPDLTWEKTDLYNVAIDLSLFDSRLNITAEAYTSRTTDLLLYVKTPSHTGYTSKLANIGTTSNKGIELSIDGAIIRKKNFTWDSMLTIARNMQMVEDIGSEDFVPALTAPGNNPYMMYGYVKGYPLNSLWGFQYGGTWKNQEEVERNKITKTYASATQITSNGTARYYDVDHNGTLNQDDLLYQGNADPYLYGGFQNSFRYKNLKFGVYFTYSLGGKIYNYSEIYMAGSMFSNQYRYMLDAWHPVRNPNSDYPRAGSVDAHVPSTLQIHDASYLRLKNLSVSYTFDLRHKIGWLDQIIVGATGENLWLLKKYNGFDPDVSSSGESSTLRRADIGAYPKPRTIIFSVQFKY